MDNLIRYRLENAKDKLKSAKLLLEAGQYKDSIGRSYYAIFSAVRAVLAEKQIDFSRHAVGNRIFSEGICENRDF